MKFIQLIVSLGIPLVILVLILVDAGIGRIIGALTVAVVGGYLSCQVVKFLAWLNDRRK